MESFVKLKTAFKKDKTTTADKSKLIQKGANIILQTKRSVI